MEEQIAKIEPELHVLENVLGWSVESVQSECTWMIRFVAQPDFLFPTLEDMLLFRFINVDETDPAREFTMVLDVSQKEYKGKRRSDPC